jgi:hypothetical protein
METSFDSGCKFLRKIFEFIHYEEEYYVEETKKHWENYFFCINITSVITCSNYVNELIQN